MFFSWRSRSTRRRSLTSRIELLTRRPSSVSSGLRLISTGNSPPLCQIANRAADQHAVFRLQRAQADLDRELLTAFPDAVQIEIGAHPARLRRREVVTAMPGMLRAEPLRDQDLHRLSQQLFALI